MADAVRAVEIGNILPRIEDSSRSLPSLPVLLSAAVLVGLAGILVLSPLLNTILGLIVGLQAVGTELSGLVTLVKAIVALALTGLAIGLVVRSIDQETVVEPRAPDDVDLLSLSRPEVKQAGGHLAGQHETCHAPRGPSAGEMVITQITQEYADRLAEIPSECQRRRRESGLYPILVGVPNAEQDVVEEVSTAYETTLLVEADETDRLPTLLGLLAHLCGNPHREAAGGIGAASLNCIRVDNYEPGHPDLVDEIREGLGDPLAAEVNAARSDEQDPAVTIVAAPGDYLQVAIDALPTEDERIIPIERPDHQPMVHIVRLFVDSKPIELGTEWTVREAPRQEDFVSSQLSDGSTEGRAATD